MSDLRLALRSLWKNPGFSAVVILTLALGIGANTAIFSLLNAIVLRPLPVRNPGELSLFYQALPPGNGDPASGNRGDLFSYQAFSRLERAAPGDIAVAAMSDAIARLSLRVGPSPDPVAVSLQLVSGRFFDTIGVAAATGRLFGPADNDTIDAEPVAVLRYGFALQQFGSADAAIGQTIAINNAVLTVVGVTRNDFAGVFAGDAVDLYAPLVMQHAVGYRQNYSTNNADGLLPWIPQGGLEWISIIGRAHPNEIERAYAPLAAAYRDEVAVEAARRRNDAVTRRFRQSTLAYESFAGGRSTVRTQFADALFVLMGMVGVVLLIACVNIANLLLARASARRADTAIRLSLGAGRVRIVRQVLAESLLLTLVGAAIAVPLGGFVSTALARLAAVRNLLPQQFTLESTVLWFAIALTMATATLVGVMPAWRATRGNPADDLRNTGTSRMAVGTRSMNILVAAQVALSVILVAIAALLARTLVNLQQFDPGFNRQHLVSVRLNTPDLRAFTPADLAPLRVELLRRAQSVPGVVAAEVSATGTFDGTRSIDTVYVAGYIAAPDEKMRAQGNRVGPGYFTTVGMQLRKGRFLDEHDVAGGRPVAVVNETFARRFMRGRDPIGVRIGLGNAADTEVVGVVGDARLNGIRQVPLPMVYSPLTQRIGFPRFVDVRVRGDAALAVGQLRRALAGVDPRITLGTVATVETALDRGISRDRLMAFVSLGFGGVALLLACVGVYGLLSYGVARRTREIGIRAALGAAPARLTMLVIGNGLQVMLPGLAIGIVITLLAMRSLQSLVFGISPYDAGTHTAVVGALLLSAVLAAQVPARRAARVDPMTALRTE